MKYIRIFSILFLFLFFASCDDADDAIILENVTNDVMSEINILRATGCQCGDQYMPAVLPLLKNDILAKTALYHAQDMNIRNYFSHISPEGISPIQRAQTFDYNGAVVGEIIAKNYYNPKSTVLGWKNSLDHCKAFMSPEYHYIGSGRSGNIWVANLGR